MADLPVPGGQTAAGDAAIRLEGVAKRYPGQRQPAVADLWLEVSPGEIVVIVGPSGCGKTTTLRLINRLISPDAGRILVEGEDVARANPDTLRRRMGYVIQQIGLFPHMTVADNVAAVPRMLAWERERITRRVDELLDLVGMDPETYRSRFPRELSGGERQRIGVARALAGDPGVLLMDEPFASIDPVTRARLQDELLRINAEVRKTILFVTHDVDEAVKMGDRIAIMDLGARVAQYDAPLRVLTDPACRFVREFVGSAATLRGLALVHVREVELAQWPVVALSTERGRIREEILSAGKEAALLVDEHGRPLRWVTVSDLEGGYGALSEAGTPAGPLVGPQTSLHDTLNEMIGSPGGRAIAVDTDGTYRGVVEMPTIVSAVERMRDAAHRGAGPTKRGDPEVVAR